MAARRRLELLRWLLVWLAAFLLGWMVNAGVKGTLATADAMTRLGWGAYLGSPRGGPLHFSIACLADARCGRAFRRAWLARYPVYLVLVFMVASGGAAVTSLLRGEPWPEKMPGGARWADARDLRPLLRGARHGPRRGYLGLSRSGRLLRPPETWRCAHTLVIGGTGAGKSTGYYKPNLLMDARDGCSAIVFDAKYPDSASGFFDMVAAFEGAGHDVQLFLPYGCHTLRLPLLAGAEDANEAARITDILTPLRESSRDGGFYSRQQRALLTGLIMGFARSETRSIGGILRLLLAGTLEVARHVRQHPDAAVRERLLGLFELREDVRHGIVRGLIEELELFGDERLSRATTASPNARENVDLAGIGTRPTLLYVGIPQDELLQRRGQVLLQLIKRTLDLALIRTANAHGGRLPVHASFYLDEFGTLGPLPDVGVNFATMRSRRVAYHVSLQNRAQGEAVYGATAFRSFITSNFRQVLILPRHLAFEDARFFSEALGGMTVLERTRGTARGRPFERPRHSASEREVSLPLLSVEEMMDWPEGEAVLMQSGMPPARVLLPRLDQARLRGRRNPLFTAVHGPPRGPGAGGRLEDALVARRAQAGGASAPVAPPASPPREVGSGAPAKPQVQEAAPSPRKALAAWLDALLVRRVPVACHAISGRRHEVARLVISRGTLPDALEPVQLGAWLERGWVEEGADALAIVGEGLKIARSGRVKRFQLQGTPRQQGKRETPRRVRAPSKRAGSRPDTVARLRAWLEENGHLVEGHPAYEALPEEERQRIRPIGRYQPATYRLPNALVRELMGKVPAGLPRVRIGNLQGVRITAGQLAGMSALSRWCDANTARLAGHPDCDGSGEVVGNYARETLALSRHELKRILGSAPDEARDRELKLGSGAQRRGTRLAEVPLDGPRMAAGKEANADEKAG